ncbi:hypothetical protein [Roseibium litorale]|uniref:Uncharacterized protein n=1 Tax=Roseibium litorale TaxID=2803841 RepID=A0ABR9CP77_9HYPH|nr:hypothetical protein [Roseibium litorale]MBD8892672.1 hypothetical protein [Roseibium litorale]
MPDDLGTWRQFIGEREYVKRNASSEAVEDNLKQVLFGRRVEAARFQFDPTPLQPWGGSARRAALYIRSWDFQAMLVQQEHLHSRSRRSFHTSCI